MNDQFRTAEMRRTTDAKRERFLAWCSETGEDPEDLGAWDDFNETDSFWDDIDADNRDGWIDNISKE